jgi:iron complex outermembrane receptor protein
VGLGGNPDLRPETSRQWTAGAIWEPVPGWSLGAQWWRIDKSNVIATLDPNFVLDNYALYGESNVIRGPKDPAYPNLPGPIDTIINWNQNLGSVKTAGVDFALRAQTTSLPAGKLSFSFDGTYIYQFLEQLPGADTYSDVGQISPYGAIPRWRHFASLNWTQGPWSATVSQTFQAGLTEYRPPDYVVPRRIGSYSLWNLQGVYSGAYNTTIALGVKNLFNTEPPFVINSRFGYDTSSGQVLGRTFYARVSIAFR